ncbi:MAG: putative bifunctional diguanylate cyclase/phosphodiesterase [Acidimicrobiales bacterium]
MRKATASIAWLLALGGVGSAWTASLAGDTTFLQALVLGAVSAAAVLTALGLGSVPRAVWPWALGAVTPVTVSAVLSAQDNLTDARMLVRDGGFLAAHLVFTAALAGLARRRLRTDLSSVVPDALIVGLGAWTVLWVVLLRPALDGGGAGAATTLLRGFGLAALSVVLFLVATALFSETRLSPSVVLSLGSVLMVGAGHILHLVDARESTSIDAVVVSAAFISAGWLAVAALLHPSSRSLLRPALRRTAPPLLTRLVATTASMGAPIVLLALTDPVDGADRAVRTASVTVLAVAVMARVVQSVRANARTQDDLLRNARTDPLTGLPNRPAMLELVASASERAWGTPRQPTVLFIDVDRFKTINDSLGHSAGDTVLLEVAGRLLAAVPPHASVGRISGDEFVILDPTTETATQAVVLAEQVLDCLREPVGVAGGDMFVSASIGVAMSVRGLGLSADEVLRHADTAMYRAKAAGRNCIAFFDDSMVERVTHRLDIETALYRALERNEVHLVHQPIVDTDLGLVVGFEALMRWDRGSAAGGTVSPAEFIPVAEETGTIVPLGSWALLDSLMQLRRWIDAGVCTSSTSVSVNVSARQLHDPSFVGVVSEALSRSGVAPDQLWLEVTESVMITEPEQTLVALRNLNAAGVRIAVDDFGTGYSSLSLLQRFPIQRIKVDRTFVHALSSAAPSQSIVRTIIAMAEALGADVVAEGVETAEQLAVLRSLNCTRAQGYLISHPVPADEIPNVVMAVEDSASWRNR